MKTLLAIIYEFVIFFPIFIVITIITALLAIVGCMFGDKSFWGYELPQLWARVTCKLALCKISIKKEVEMDPNKSYVFVGNHQSYFDIFLVYGYLGVKIKWVQKQSLRKIPLVGKACEIIGHVYVDSSSPRATKNTIDKIKSELKEGYSMTIFPEGQRTRSGKMEKFKKGAFRIADDMKLPIVPITLNGPFDVMRRGSFIIYPAKKMELIIHEPIDTTNMTPKEETDLMERTRKIVYSDLWDKYK